MELIGIPLLTAPQQGPTRSRASILTLQQQSATSAICLLPPLCVSGAQQGSELRLQFKSNHNQLALGSALASNFPFSARATFFRCSSSSDMRLRRESITSCRSHCFSKATDLPSK
ncbi:uncharacterized protein LOC144580513 [Callithrix jacchus]